MEGAYIPLTCEGELKDHICAFARQKDNTAVMIIVPRFVVNLPGFRPELPLGENVWGNTAVVIPDEISDDTCNNVLTGERVEVVRGAERRTLPLQKVFSRLPVAMLEIRKSS